MKKRVCLKKSRLQIVGMSDVYLVHRRLTTKLIPIVEHLTRGNNSGMDSWFQLMNGETEDTWAGVPPKYCVVVFCGEQAIGWCGLSILRSDTDLINTFVKSDFRGKGIAQILVQEVLKFHDRKRIIAYDRTSWDLGSLFKKNKIKSVNFWAMADEEWQHAS